MKSLVGLADLARLLRALPVEDRAEAAALLGFRRAGGLGATGVAEGEPGPAVEDEAAKTSPPPREHRITHDSRRSTERPAAPPPPPARTAALLGFRGAAAPTAADVDPSGPGKARADAGPSAGDAPANPAGFLRVEAAVTHETAAMTGPLLPPQGLNDDDLKSEARSSLPPSPPLAAWSTLWARLRAALQTSRSRRDPDVTAVIRTWARGECLRRIQRLGRRTWPALATLWIDRSSRLAPFWNDQEMVYRQLVRLCGVAAIERRVLDDNQQASLAAWSGDLIGQQPPDPAVPVLVLGDLGFYGTEADRARWLRTARRLRRGGVRIATLVPCPIGRWDRESARAWNATPWESASTAGDRGTAKARAEALLRLVAPTDLAQPGLLRALRQLLPAATADASTEVDVWRHVDVRVADVNGLVLKSEASARWRERFAADVPPATQVQVSRLIDQWHGGWRAELIHAETLTWIAHGIPGAPGRPDEARAFAEKVAATLCGASASREEVAIVKQYGRHLLGAFPVQGYSMFPELKLVWSVSFAEVADAQLPGTIAPSELFVRSPQEPRGWVAFQRREVMIMIPAASWASAADDESGSPVATITAATPEVWVQRGADTRSTRTWLTPHVEIPLYPGERIALRTDLGEVALEVWARAPWATAAGRDRYGLWASFEVKGVQQRLRWIPPGRFLMGSPSAEVGSRRDDGPPHWVTLTKGYWLGETPVTQALWRAVMKSTPSQLLIAA